MVGGLACNIHTQYNFRFFSCFLLRFFFFTPCNALTFCFKKNMDNIMLLKNLPTLKICIWILVHDQMQFVPYCHMNKIKNKCFLLNQA